VRLRNDQGGFIALEMLTSFVVFVICFVIIITFVNLASVQLRVHHALTQTVKEIAFYTYGLHVVGVTGFIQETATLATAPTAQLGGMVGNAFDVWDGMSGMTNATSLEGIKNAAGSLVNNAEQGMEAISDVARDPMAALRGIITVGVNEGMATGLSHLFGNVIAPYFFWDYMAVEGLMPGDGRIMTGRQYFERMPVQHPDSPDISFAWHEFDRGQLRAGNISGFVRPTGSQFLGGAGNAEITLGIRYHIDFSPHFILPERMRTGMSVVVSAMGRAWIGDGRAYKPSVTPLPRGG